MRITEKFNFNGRMVEYVYIPDFSYTIYLCLN